MTWAPKIRLSFFLSALVLVAALVSPPAQAATVKRCKPVLNPYPGTRFHDVDLTRIRATGVSCRIARRVARGAQRKGLGLPPPVSGIRRFGYRGWTVIGDIRGQVDRYLAKAPGGKRVRWRF